MPSNLVLSKHAQAVQVLGTFLPLKLANFKTTQLLRKRPLEKYRGLRTSTPKKLYESPEHQLRV